MNEDSQDQTIRMTVPCGQAFQAETRYSRHRMTPHMLDWEHMPPTYKRYQGTPVLGLPVPEPPGAIDPGLWPCIRSRRSRRTFSSGPLSLAQISTLLWASAGITWSEPEQYLRSAPSAGALYPIETYIAVHAVEDLPSGLYHYRLVGVDDRGRLTREGGHSLEQLSTPDIRQGLAAAALDQDIAGDAGAVFIWTAVLARSVWKYRQRAYRYVYLDAGHVAQNLLLAAEALNLAACPIAAFYDDEVASLLGVDIDTEAPLYMVVVGRE